MSRTRSCSRCCTRISTPIGSWCRDADAPPAGRAGGSPKVDTLDDLLLDRLDLLKIRTGTDAEILQGASATMWRLRPMVFIAARDADASATWAGGEDLRLSLLANGAATFRSGQLQSSGHGYLRGEPPWPCWRFLRSARGRSLDGCEPIGSRRDRCPCSVEDEQGCSGGCASFLDRAGLAPAASDIPIEQSNLVLSQVRTLIADAASRARDACRSNVCRTARRGAGTRAWLGAIPLRRCGDCGSIAAPGACARRR